ncbi:putative MFS family arabinose efflux permease [Sphingomonas sp. PP-F2F-G114-C0414]|uniref:MFS transporter n=1 Tax=Sphingomonas sp. PP-F2F-G114-C0414 TaxID=2135662 RepID=UPI000F0EDFC1|nr:MFS transporter [Sphingomonas sp. PP-F2F-G114-C0414]RMB35694.1 putative MFS family arabinose efflux permease [Sphingomonas sp. PP-F2F-G114-C0414]
MRPNPIPTDVGASDTLPISALLALAMTGFTAILTETLPAGLLPHIAAGLDVSESLAGQTVTVYAVGSLLAAIPLTLYTQGWRRKPTLLVAIVGFLIFNCVTAVSTSYALTLVARFMGGVAAGLGWGIIAGYARRMVVAPLRGRALAIAMVGTPLALSIGVPLGAMLGTTLGWRMAFGLMSITTLILIGWVLWQVPDFPGQPAEQRLSIARVFRTPGVRTVLVTLFAWITAHNILYTYIAPVAALSGVQARLDLLLLGFGVAALVGIWVTGVLIDRALRPLVLVSLTVFAAVSLAFGLFAASPVVTIAATILWGLSFGGAATQLQTALADAAGEGVDLANAILTTTWNGAIAAGGIIGGVMLDHLGAGSLAWAVLGPTLLALVIASRARRHAFKSGPRAFD